MRSYIGLIHKDANSDFGVSFPNFPGVVTAGGSLDEARAMAEEALALHIEGLLQDEEAIPEPSPLVDIMSDDPDNKWGVAIHVPARLLPGAHECAAAGLELHSESIRSGRFMISCREFPCGVPA